MASAMLAKEMPPRMMPPHHRAHFEQDQAMDDDMAEHENRFTRNQLHNGVYMAGGAGEDQDALGEEEEGEEDQEGASDEDAEGGEENDDGAEEDQEDDGESGDEEDEGVGAVKIQPGLQDDDDEDAVIEDDESASEASKEFSDGESEVEEEWEAAAAEDDEDEAEPMNPNRCIFCQQGEEDDPSEEFEEYLACAVCGDNSHRQCARNAEAFMPDEDGARWRCPSCVENALEPDAAILDIEAPLSARHSSAPKLARDLLPSQRGAVKPDSHSMFNQLIVNDDPMDGSRTLRKRKTSSIEPEDGSIGALRKRRKGSSSNAIASTEDGEEAAEDAEPPGDEQGQPVETEGVETNGLSTRSSRSLRPKSSGGARGASILKNTRTSLVVAVRVDPEQLEEILSKAPKPEKPKRKRVRPPAASRANRVSVAPPVSLPSATYSQPFYAFHDREHDDLKSKPYGGILKEAEADTTRTLPGPNERRLFDKARQEAEDEWKVKTAEAQAEAEKIKKPKKVSAPGSQIECINFGGYEIDTWYAAPYPEEYSRNRVLYICEFCLKYMSSDYVAWRHKLKCPAKHPPGDEIYRAKSISVFEVDGRKNPVYCQNLCLLAKLFLGSKTLYYDVEPFLFYVMTEYDELGCHFVGYFSKEKRPSSQNNVSCILTLPIHQRKGYGNLLIDFSYLLTRVEKKSGSPEKPLSDMGLVSYRNYWRLVMCYKLREIKGPFSIVDLSEKTGMTADDIVSALEGLRALVRDPVTGIYAYRLDYKFFDEYIDKWEKKNYVKLDPKALVWTPYVMGRNNASAFDHPPPLNTVAPRDGENEEADSKPELQTRSIVTNGDITRPAETNGDTNGNTNEENKIQESETQDVEMAENADRDAEISPTSTPAPRPKGKPSGKPSKDKGKENVSPSKPKTLTITLPPVTNGASSTVSKPSPDATYNHNIPPTRFVVFPPVPGGRSVLSRPRTSTSSRSRPRTSSSRSTARRRTNTTTTGGSRSNRSRPRARSTARSNSNPDIAAASSSRRKSGGTGRGPGRWPKGTKKSDFGNADSGPGLPPRMLKQRSKLGNELTLSDGDEGGDLEREAEQEEQEDPDAMLYETPGPSRPRRREGTRSQGKPSGQGLGKPSGQGLGKPNGQGLGKPSGQGLGKPSGIGKGKGKGKAAMTPDADDGADEQEADENDEAVVDEEMEDVDGDDPDADPDAVPEEEEDDEEEEEGRGGRMHLRR